MSQLEKMQTDFQNYIIHKNETFMYCIVDDELVGATTRLNIYYNGYRLRIIESLATSYPKLQAWLGDDVFNNIARGYIANYPSTYSNMRWVGDKMDLHLKHALAKQPFSAELAQFEWALGLAFDAEDAPILQLADLVKIAPEDWADLQFRFHPCLQLLPTRYNVIAIWKALDLNATPPKPKLIRQHTVIWRYNLDSYFRSVDQAEYAALQLVASGASFGELCESLQSESGEVATNIAAQYLSTWLNDEIIQAID
ncbi:MAG: DNA-binding domain-containing protein [Methylophilaceae bacterium]